MQMDLPRPIASGIYARFILVQPVGFDVHGDQESPFQQLGSPPIALSILYKVRCDLSSIGTPLYTHICCYMLFQPMFWVAVYVWNANNGNGGIFNKNHMNAVVSGSASNRVRSDGVGGDLKEK
jgi:hypothetical protein